MCHATAAAGRSIVLLVPALVLACLTPPGMAAEKPWPSDVPDWRPVKPGEHPRLIFRSGDLAELRKRADRPEGKVIVDRCRKMLEQRYTTWNAAGYAFLYQITGEKQYADQAKVAVEQTFARKANPDGRYTYPGNGQLRAGPVLGAIGLAYDMAYDRWDRDFRKKVAETLEKNPDYTGIPNRPSHGPGCNHYGAHTGGVGLALLALRGDPEADGKLVEGSLAKVVTNAKREIAEGYGEKGYYYEGHYCGRISSNTGLLPFIQAYRVAAGKDLVKNSSNAQWLVAKWIYEFTRYDGKVRNLPRGMYGRDPFTRGEMLSSDGDFAQGFGICPDEYKPALLWLYNHVVQPGKDVDYDVLEYPHLAAFALANWPFDRKEKSPEDVLPRTHHDQGPNYFVFRNGWKGDESDMVVTALLGSSPDSGRGMGKGGSVQVLARGMRYSLPGIFYASKLTYSKLEKDGSGVVSAVVGALMKDNNGHKALKSAGLDSAQGATSLAVDYSGKSGAELLVAQVGPQVGFQVEYWMQISKAKPQDEKGKDGYATKTTLLQVGGANGVVMTVQKGSPPAVRADGKTITVGGQTLTWDGEKLTVGK